MNYIIRMSESNLPFLLVCNDPNTSNINLKQSSFIISFYNKQAGYTHFRKYADAFGGSAYTNTVYALSDDTLFKITPLDDETFNLYAKPYDKSYYTKVWTTDDNMKMLFTDENKSMSGLNDVFYFATSDSSRSYNPVKLSNISSLVQFNSNQYYLKCKQENLTFGSTYEGYIGSYAHNPVILPVVLSVAIPNTLYNFYDDIYYNKNNAKNKCCTRDYDDKNPDNSKIYEGACALFNYAPGTDTCDKYMDGYCKTHLTEDVCGCYNVEAELIKQNLTGDAATLFRPHPKCWIKKCYSGGYKNKDVRDDGDCNITVCNSAINVSGNSNVMSNMKQMQTCNASSTGGNKETTSITTTQPTPSGGTNASTTTTVVEPKPITPTPSDPDPEPASKKNYYIIIIIVIVIIALGGCAIYMMEDEPYQPQPMQQYSQQYQPQPMPQYPQPMPRQGY